MHFSVENSGIIRESNYFIYGSAFADAAGIFIFRISEAYDGHKAVIVRDVQQFPDFLVLGQQFRRVSGDHGAETAGIRQQFEIGCRQIDLDEIPVPESFTDFLVGNEQMWRVIDPENSLD